MTFDPRIRTVTGRLVDPWNLTPEDIHLDDISFALSGIVRFNGHSRALTTVAEHCIMVAELLFDTPYALEGLMHDASEAYLCDIPTPIKRQLSMGSYRAAERRAHRAIAKRYGLSYRSLVPGHFIWPDEVKAADAQALGIEMQGRDRTGYDRPSHGQIEDAFTDLFHKLWAEREGRS